ncbi:hypothetical protein, partial [Staphylococcus warneri]|uniref:hypothetical protein n=1 Tax=Staphylococcus warneri TaxID=1292 RepID=UPI0011A7B981
QQHFTILQPKPLTLPQLPTQLQNITPTHLIHSTPQIKPLIPHLPNFQSHTHTFLPTYPLNHQNHFIHPTFTPPKNQPHHLKQIPLNIQLITYITKT